MTTDIEARALKRVRKTRYVGLPTIRTMTDRIVARCERASADQWAAGMSWYAAFGGVADALAGRHGVTTREAIGVLAVVSPRVSVGTSVAVADEILRHWSDGSAERARWTVGRALPENVGRAVDYLQGDTAPLDLDVDGQSEARKVRSFARNIDGCPDSVTVDTWACKAAGVDTDRVDQPRGGAYIAVAHAYRLAAKRLGITPRECQAVAWCAERSDIDAAAELEALRVALESGDSLVAVA